MISHEKLASYFDLLIVFGGSAFIFLRYGQLRLPLQKSKRLFLSLASQLIFTIHFALEAGINASRQDRALLFYIYLIGALSGFGFALYQYSLLEREVFSSRESK